MKEDNQAVIKALNMYGKVPEMYELLEEIEKYKDIVLDLENERDVLKSKLSETKADIKYLIEHGESNGYIRNKYIRGDLNE